MLRMPARFAALVVCFAPLFQRRGWRHSGAGAAYGDQPAEIRL
jgi:hypothetical protein